MGNLFSSKVEDVVNIDNALAEKFAAVKVSKKQVDHAEATMNEIFFDSWKESMVHDVSKGVSKDKIGEFGDNLLECLGLDNESPEARKLKANLRKINITTGANAHAIMEIDFNVDSFKSMYGFICSVDQNNGKVAIAYAFHELTFKISSDDMGQRVGFGVKDIQAIKNTYSKHKALTTLLEEGIIPCINYDEG